MLPKHLRLPARMIPLVAYKGKKSVGKYLEVRAELDVRMKYPLFAITVTTKTSKNAVVRNKIRRQLKVEIERLVTAGKVKQGRYIVLVRSNLAVEADLISELDNQLAAL